MTDQRLRDRPIRDRVRQRAVKASWLLLGGLAAGVLVFAALGVRDTLTGGSSALSRVANGVLHLAVLAFAAVGVLDTIRGSALRRVRTFGRTGHAVSVDDPMFRVTMETLTGTPLTPGNDVRLLLNGDETLSSLWSDLRAASRSIAIQLYYWSPGRMANEIHAILSERARAGVRVLLLVDAFGAEELPESWFLGLRAAGVEIARFRPVHWYSLNRLNNRSHVRAVIIDRTIGFTGGFGIADKWYGDGQTVDQWRDTNVRFMGPAVAQLFAAFTVGWAEATGDLLTADGALAASESDNMAERAPSSSGASPLGAPGSTLGGVLHTPPTLGSTRAERFMSLSIAAARQHLYISNAYFVPGREFRRMLERAARRGVDVRVLTAGPATDVRTMWYAGRAHYRPLLTAGVRIYEYAPTMMHAKTLVVDGSWSAVGTMNFDNRSMVLNDEVNFVALDAAFGCRLEQLFANDCARSSEIVLEEFRRRPPWQRTFEWVANLAARVL